MALDCMGVSTMVNDDSSRRFIQLLANWANAEPGDREPKRALLDPLDDEFWCWLRVLVGTYYWDNFNRRGGISKAEFEDECICRALSWVKRHKEEVVPGRFTIHHLEARVRTVAENYRNTIGRRLRRRWFHSLDKYREAFEDEIPGRTPEGLQVPPDDPTLARYPGLEGEFLQAQRLIPEFERSLHGQEKTLELLASLRHLGDKLGKLHGFPRDWLPFRILKPKRKHLPAVVRKFLRVYFSSLKDSILDGRLSYLRRTFREFLLSREDPNMAV
jgi:hypothetical protein